MCFFDEVVLNTIAADEYFANTREVFTCPWDARLKLKPNQLKKPKKCKNYLMGRIVKRMGVCFEPEQAEPTSSKLAFDNRKEMQLFLD